MRPRMRISAINLCILREDAPHRESGGAIAVLALIFKQKNAAGLRRLLIHERETMRSVPREQFKTYKRIPPKSFLPAGAGRRKPWLPQSAREHKLAGDGRGCDRVTGCVKEIRVELLLVQNLADKRRVEGRVVNSPPEREFGAVISEREHIGRYSRLAHSALREAVPVRAQARLKNEMLAH